jgi:hypothetical protein
MGRGSLSRRFEVVGLRVNIGCSVYLSSADTQSRLPRALARFLPSAVLVRIRSRSRSLRCTGVRFPPNSAGACARRQGPLSLRGNSTRSGTRFAMAQ